MCELCKQYTLLKAIRSNHTALYLHADADASTVIVSESICIEKTVKSYAFVWSS